MLKEKKKLKENKKKKKSLQTSLHRPCVNNNTSLNSKLFQRKNFNKSCRVMNYQMEMWAGCDVPIPWHTPPTKIGLFGTEITFPHNSSVSYSAGW